MDRLGIAFAFLSVSSPNLSKADRETEIHMVHQINTEGAEIVQRHTNRLGLFASLPLPYTAPAIAEAEFALSELKADGFALSTNYAGIYLGDPAYDPLLEYLDTVGAVVAVHPVKPFGMPKGVNSGLPIPRHGVLHGHDQNIHKHGHARRVRQIPKHSVDLSACRRFFADSI